MAQNAIFTKFHESGHTTQRIAQNYFKNVNVQGSLNPRANVLEFWNVALIFHKNEEKCFLKHVQSVQKKQKDSFFKKKS